MAIDVGDKLPSVALYEGAPDKTVDVSELFGEGTKGIIFGVPGAFTPGCSKTHLPGYLENHDDLKEKGVNLIVCVAVNDPFVMEAWGQNHNVDGKIRMLADPRAEFTKALGLDLDLSAVLGGVRSKRYAMVIEDGVVKHISVEPDNIGLTCTLAPEVSQHL